MKMKNGVNFKEKMINYMERGITLVALVITIIILLILTGVILNTALSDNELFQKAKFAGEKYKEAEKQEQSTLESIAEEIDKISIDYNDYVGATVTGYKITNKKENNNPFVINGKTSGLKSNMDDKNNIIDGVEENLDQKFKTEELGWKIWDYDKYTKTVRLISSKPTTAKLALSDATGYNNGVWAINEVCRQCYGQYNENGEMKRGITVANLRRTDIQKVSKYDYTQYKHKLDESQEETVNFGESKTYTTNPQYPVMWENFDSHWNYGYDGEKETRSDKECEIWERENGYKIESGVKTGNNPIEFKQSAYMHDYKDNKNEFINEEYFNLLFNYETEAVDTERGYWLACRDVDLYSSFCDFGLQYMQAANSFCGVQPIRLSNTLRTISCSSLSSSPCSFY